MKSFVLVLGMVMMLAMSWEQSKADAVLAQGMTATGTNTAGIPQESIRLRILADSDAPADQVLKRRIRDAVIESMNQWVTGPQTLEEARATIREHLPEIELMASDMAAAAGFKYNAKAELGSVPFPTKVYGGEVYPAGDYEALRITLGRGLGQNWWCVLFPPLCFVDVAAAETPTGASAAVDIDSQEEPEVEYRFFLVELVLDFIEAIRTWFA
jgi:stage II sporulation protein R